MCVHAWCVHEIVFFFYAGIKNCTGKERELSVFCVMRNFV